MAITITHPATMTMCITFDGESGDYCVKVMRCTGTLSNASALRSWPCPM